MSTLEFDTNSHPVNPSCLPPDTQVEDLPTSSHRHTTKDLVLAAGESCGLSCCGLERKKER